MSSMCFLNLSLSSLGALAAGSSGTGSSMTYSFLSCLRTILKFQNQSRKLMPFNFSFSRFCFCLNGGAVSWKSSKQDTIADSTTEAEYIAASEAVKEAVWIKKFVTKLGVVPSISDAMELYCDNNGAIAQAKEPRSHQRSKHILRRFHLIRQIIDRGDVEICKVHIDDNIADPLTKPLTQQKHDRHNESLGIRYVSDWS
ncbi:hypothetical protein V6N13_098675 [Hibiscus sabdariffa]